MAVVERGGRFLGGDVAGLFLIGGAEIVDGWVAEF